MPCGRYALATLARWAQWRRAHPAWKPAALALGLGCGGVGWAWAPWAGPQTFDRSSAFLAPPVNVPEPPTVLLFGGAVAVTIVLRIFRK